MTLGNNEKKMLSAMRTKINHIWSLDELLEVTKWQDQVHVAGSGKTLMEEEFVEIIETKRKIVSLGDEGQKAVENGLLEFRLWSWIIGQKKSNRTMKGLFDAGFERVEAVVAHEYFHNWSGNRVTCRDWFQLSLKEGFTVYRDAEFSADMNSRAVKRINDASLMRSVQFAEDAGPMSHSVRPDSFIEISNFYTVTIYEKGAEVVRMLANILGPELFRKARVARNPKNSNKINIPPRKAIKWKMSKNLFKRMNSNFNEEKIPNAL